MATTNAGKLREIRAALAGAPIVLCGLDTVPPLAEPEETGATFDENARLKARYYSAHTGLVTVAEDSGLSIDALGGEPGVRSARYLHPSATYEARFADLHRRLATVPPPNRTARFVCALAVANGGDVMFEAAATIEGLIGEEARGAQGFGYDPIFYYPPFGATLAEVTLADKLRVSHRGQAFRVLRRWLASESADRLLRR